MRFLSLLALTLALGCSDAAPHRPLSSMALGGIDPDSSRTYQSTHTDSIKTWYTTIRVDTLVDTVFVPTAPAVTGGVRFGASQVPIDSLGSLYGVMVRQLSPSTMLADLARIKARGGRIVLTLSRMQTRDSIAGDSVLSVKATARYLATWPDSAKLNPYFRDSTILQIRTSDDIVSAKIWGVGAPFKSRIDSLGMLVKKKYPLATTSLRALPTQMTGYKWRWTDAAWAQYAKLDRMGTAEAFRDAQIASAKAQGLCLVFGVNATGYEDASPAEIENYALVFGPYTPFFTYWWYTLPYSEIPEVKAAFGRAQASLAKMQYRGCPK